jgi:hypothetical protein
VDEVNVGFRGTRTGPEGLHDETAEAFPDETAEAFPDETAEAFPDETAEAFITRRRGLVHDQQDEP